MQFIVFVSVTVFAIAFIFGLPLVSVLQKRGLLFTNCMVFLFIPVYSIKTVAFSTEV